MPTRLLDKAALDHQLLLSVPYREMANQLTMDRARPHHPLQGHNLTWSSGWPIVPSQIHLGVYDGASAYTDSPAADTVDLDFTTGDYGLAAWVFYQATALSQLVIGRYWTDLDGWELYLHDPNSSLSLRHHHGSLADTRSGCYSLGWPVGQWHLVGVSRSGAYPRMFRNGTEVEVTYDPGGLSDPDSANRDLVIGARCSKNANWYSGYQSLLRVWGRSLEPWEHRQIFEMERHWFL